MRIYSELNIKHALTVPLSFEIKMVVSEETDIERPGTSGTSIFFILDKMMIPKSLRRKMN